MFSFFKKKESVPENVLIAPCDGTIYPIEEVKDAVFSQKMLGDGIAITMPNGKVKVCAVASGTISALYPTGHAFGITMANGMDVLVHIGIDTVEANGEGFRVLTKQDAKVQAGDALIEVDVPKLAEKFDTSLLVVITETAGHKVDFVKPGTVAAKAVIANIVK